MTKVLVPGYVSEALTRHGEGQLNAISAICVYVKTQTTPVVGKELAETLYSVSDHVSVKSYQNFIACAMNLIGRTSVAAFISARAKDAPARIVVPLRDYLKAQTKAADYGTSTDDLSAWAKGTDSLAVLRLKKAKAEEEAAARVKQQEAAAAALKAEQALKAAAEKAAEPATVVDPLASDTSPAPVPLPATDAPATPDAPRAADGSLPPAIIAPKMIILSVERKPDGLDITLGQSLTRDDLVVIMQALQSELDQMAVAPVETAPV